MAAATHAEASKPADTRPLVWSFFEGFDLHDRPETKIIFRYVIDGESKDERIVGFEWDGGVLFLDALGRKRINPTQDDLDALKADVERYYEDRATELKLEDAAAVRAW